MQNKTIHKQIHVWVNLVLFLLVQKSHIQEKKSKRRMTTKWLSLNRSRFNCNQLMLFLFSKLRDFGHEQHSKCGPGVIDTTSNVVSHFCLQKKYASGSQHIAQTHGFKIQATAKVCFGLLAHLILLPPNLPP
jgi:hypothetical protein